MLTNKATDNISKAVKNIQPPASQRTAVPKNYTRERKIKKASSAAEPFGKERPIQADQPFNNEELEELWPADNINEQADKEPKKKAQMHPAENIPKADLKRKAVQLRNKGYTSREIGQKLGKSHSTILEWINEATNKNNTLQQFKNNRADILAQDQMQSLHLQRLIKNTWTAETIEKLTEYEKMALFNSLGKDAGIKSDKEYRERNGQIQGTMIQVIIDTAHQRLMANKLQLLDASDNL